MRSRDRPSSLLALTIGVALVALAVVAWTRAEAPRVFFSGDEGLKSVQRRAFAEGRETLSDPSRQLAAAVTAGSAAGTTRPKVASLSPWRPPFVQPCAGGLCSVWRNPVVRIGGVAERVGGPPLAAAVAWLGLVLWLLATALLALRLGASAAGTAAALLFGTPAWLYGVVFWEHAPAAAAVTAALAWTLGERSVGSRPRMARAVVVAAGLGAAVALAVLSRPESGLLVIVAAALAWRRRHRAELAAWVVGGLVAGSLALWLGDGLAGWVGNNVSRAATGEGDWLNRRSLQSATLLAGLRGGSAPSGATAGLAASTAGILLLARWAPPRVVRSLGWLLLATSAAALASLWAWPGAQIVGLLLAAPVAVIGLASGLRAAPTAHGPAAAAQGPSADAPAPSTDARLLAIGCALSLLAALLASPNDGGSQWGPRYLLPWLAPTLAFALAAPAAWRPLVRAALVLGLVAQLIGVRNLASQQADKSAAIRWLLASPARTLVAQAWYTPQELAGLSLDSRSLDHGWQLALAADLPALQRATDALVTREERWWIFAADPRLNAAGLLGRGGHWRVVGSRDVGFPPVQVRLHLIEAQRP